jgi:hypothetical protein
MDKLVRRVTIVRGSGENRQTDVVYKSGDDEDADLDMPRFNKLERSVRHLLKAQVIGAQEAYQRHLESVEKGGLLARRGSIQPHQGTPEGHEGGA